jgi:hypothetical protein
MADEPQPEKHALDPDAKKKTKAERIEQERTRLLEDVAATVTDDLRSKVGYILSHYPEARDSDVALAHRLWETFYPELIEGDRVRLDDMYALPRQNSISRVRAKIQNEYGLFQPSAEVADARRTLRDDTKAEMGADKPGPPVLTVYADESGKSQHYLVVGSVWILDISKAWRVVFDLRQWQKEAGIEGEFKFAELNKTKKEQAIAFVKKAMEYSQVMGLKACVLDKLGLKAKTEEVVSRLYYELAMTGVEHEIEVGRVVLPRSLAIVKDADDGPDALMLPELTRRLTVACRDYFNGTVMVDSVMTGRSHESPLLQLADLFSGSVGRIMNKDGDGTNHKDGFAAFFETVAGFDLKAESKGSGDFVYVHRLA